MNYKNIKHYVTSFIILYVMVLRITSVNCQEKNEHKIKTDGEFEYSFTFLEKEIKGVYKGDYYKSKIDGEKLKIPHGKGVLQIRIFDNEYVECGSVWADGKLNGDAQIICDDFTFLGIVTASLPDSGSLKYNYKTDYLKSISLLEQNFIPKKYEGTFLNGKYLKGSLISLNNRQYLGEFKNGVFDGEGKLGFNKDWFFEGYFKNGMMNGKGTRKIEGVGSFTGVFINDTIVGNVIYKYENGGIYEGTILNSSPSGKGKYLFKTGEVYEGDFLYGKFEGEGIYRTNDRVVKSSFKGSNTSGKSIVTFNNGKIYEGELINLCIPNGVGKLTYTNGDFEKGDFKNGDFKSGLARYTINGTIWQGDFVYKKESGVSLGYTGTIIYTNGNIYKGEWGFFSHPKTVNPDNCQGDCHHFDVTTTTGREEGVFKLSDNSIYSGTFNQLTGLPSFYGTITYQDGKQIKGKFVNGIFQGDQEEVENDEYTEGTFQGQEEEVVHPGTGGDIVTTISSTGNVVTCSTDQLVMLELETMNLDVVNCKIHTKQKPGGKVFINKRLHQYRLKNKKVLCPKCNPVSVNEKELLEGKH